MSMDRDQHSLTESENFSLGPVHDEAQALLPFFNCVTPCTQRSPASTQNSPPDPGSSPGSALSQNLAPDPTSPPSVPNPVVAPSQPAPHTIPRIKEVKCEMFTG